MTSTTGQPGFDILQCPAVATRYSAKPFDYIFHNRICYPSHNEEKVIATLLRAKGTCRATVRIYSNCQGWRISKFLHSLWTSLTKCLIMLNAAHVNPKKKKPNSSLNTRLSKNQNSWVPGLYPSHFLIPSWQGLARNNPKFMTLNKEYLCYFLIQEINCRALHTRKEGQRVTMSSANLAQGCRMHNAMFMFRKKATESNQDFLNSRIVWKVSDISLSAPASKWSSGKSLEERFPPNVSKLPNVFKASNLNEQ